MATNKNPFPPDWDGTIDGLGQTRPERVLVGDNPPTFSSPTSAPVVKIYVRRGQTNQERTIAFSIPAGMPLQDILDTGFALDGNQAIFNIVWVNTGWYRDAENESHEEGYFDAPFGNQGHSLSSALNTAQRELVAYLSERGFTPEFA